MLHPTCRANGQDSLCTRQPRCQERSLEEYEFKTALVGMSKNASASVTEGSLLSGSAEVVEGRGVGEGGVVAEVVEECVGGVGAKGVSRKRLVVNVRAQA